MNRLQISLLDLLNIRSKIYRPFLKHLPAVSLCKHYFPFQQFPGALTAIMPYPLRHPRMLWYFAKPRECLANN